MKFWYVLICFNLWASVLPHKMGSLQFSKKPKKVVALEFSFVDALGTLGITPVGIADDNDPKRVLPQLKIGNYVSLGSRKAPSLELIARLRPDMILADSKRHSPAYQQLEKIAPTMVLDGLGQDYDLDLKNLSIIAKAVGKEGILGEKLALHQNFLQQISKKLKHLKSKKILFMVSWEEGVHIHTKAAFVPSLLSKINLTYVPTHSNNASEKINLEQLVKLNPDILIIARRPSKVLIDDWMNSPLWKLLTAFKEQKIYFVDQTLWTRMRGLTSAEVILQDLEKLNI